MEFLKKYGLTPYFEQQARLFDSLQLARVSEQHRDLYKVITQNGEMTASVSGKLAYRARQSTDFPAVGDWVMIDYANPTAIIHQVLNRKSAFIRKSAGTEISAQQIVAANIDIIFICMSLNEDFSLRRLERYMTAAWDSMATPVVVLTKADLCDDIQTKLAEIAAITIGIDVIVCSALNGYGYDEVLKHIDSSKTVAFIGSSGVGKSTLINKLMKEDILDTGEIRKDGKGRHTTTHRQLLLLPEGGIVIDTPGMRELQLSSADISKSFEDIEMLAFSCRFRDCTHNTEPGCAVKAAIENGDLSKERLESYKKLKKEIGYMNLNFRQLEREKIKNMFGGVNKMKQTMNYVKDKDKNR